MGSGNQEKERLGSSVGFVGYFVLNFIGAAAVSILVIELFSSIGNGEETLDSLKDMSSGSTYCFAAVFGCVLVLYQLDFFWPPHIPGQYCLLWAGGAIVGGIIVGILAIVVLAGCFFMAADYPWMPLLLTTFCTPFVILGIRLATRPQFNRDCVRIERLLAQGGDLGPELALQAMKTRQELVDVLKAQEHERRVYYGAVQAALLLVALGTFIVWLLWALSDDSSSEETSSGSNDTADEDDNEEGFILWVAPLVVSVSYLSFTLIIVFRLALGGMYRKTDDMPTRLEDKLRLDLNPPPRASDSGLKRVSHLFQKTTSIGSQDQHQEMKQKVRASLQQIGGDDFKGLSTNAQEDIVENHVELLARLRLHIMALGCSIFALLAVNYVVYQLVTDNKNVLLMFQAYLSMMLIFCIAFTYTSFRRVWRTLGSWVTDMPLFKMCRGLSKSDWVRALGTFGFGLFAPLVLAVSMLNQCIRRCRGLDHIQSSSKMSTDADLLMDAQSNSASPDPPATAEAESPQRSRLTPRVQHVANLIGCWDWLSVVKKTYAVAIAIVVFVLTPLLLNVFLAWMYKLLADQEMAMIILAVFACGLVLFLLPPVPGAPVYLFGGVLISGKGEEIGGMSGYWIWSVVCIFVCWILKLVACAVQQKGIGGMLGGKLWVRQTVGVHKPFIRAIEVVLRRPGLSFGKCMILMGGPDWPTSVLAGVLKLSLLQCEIGTMPIISYIAPLSLTGSFYLKRDAGQTWKNAGDLMFSLTALMTLLYWVAIGWVIQGVLDEHHERLTQPREEYIDLDWLDYRDAQLAGSCAFTMSDVPLWVKVPFIAGCIGCVVLGQALYWAPTLFFGEFAVTGDVDDLEVYGEDGLITFLGVVALGGVAVCACGYCMYSCWHRSRSKEPRHETAQRLISVEEEWKAQRREEAKQAAAKLRAECEEMQASGSVVSGTSVHHPPIVEESPFGPRSYTANFSNNRTMLDEDCQSDLTMDVPAKTGKLKAGKTMPAVKTIPPADAEVGQGEGPLEAGKSANDTDGNVRRLVAKGTRPKAKRAVSQDALHAATHEGLPSDGAPTNDLVTNEVTKLPRARTKKLAAKELWPNGFDNADAAQVAGTNADENGVAPPSGKSKKILRKCSTMPADGPSGKSDSRQRAAGQQLRNEAADGASGDLARSAVSSPHVTTQEKAVKPTVVGRIAEETAEEEEEEEAGAVESPAPPTSKDAEGRKAKGDKARRRLKARKRQESNEAVNVEEASGDAAQLDDFSPESDRD